MSKRVEAFYENSDCVVMHAGVSVLFYIIVKNIGIDFDTVFDIFYQYL